MDATSAVVTIVSALIAVLGTLAGVRIQQRATEAAERAVREERRREERRAACRALLAAARLHRRAIYTRLQSRGDGEESVREAKYRSWETRTEVSAALDDIQLLVGDAVLLGLADRFAAATFGMKQPGEPLAHLTRDLLDDRSARSRAAERAFRAAARDLLGG